ncbi:MAG TPA: energy transducer TonB [Thermoanaerobaculia bacterium]
MFPLLIAVACARHPSPCKEFVNPVAFHQPGPQVPPGFWDTHKDSAVTLEVRIGNEGSITDPQVITSPGEDYSIVALQTLQSWRFRPALCDGRPIGSTLTLTMQFAHGFPGEVARCITALGSEYRIATRLNPFYLHGDFDGDGRTDYAVLVARGEENGILICRAGGAKPIVLGAGRPLNDVRNLNFDAWMIYPRAPVQRGVGEGSPPTLRGDAIEVVWSETASALLYWNGSRFQWYQQGD